ncbi:MAG: hypothetical protein K2M97_00640 [Muribaculaceae bacterium]|nr:hypothetical protein [Muribaculaceae bacterium]
MGLQTFIKRAFGFSVEEIDEETDVNLNTVDSQMIPTLQPAAAAPAPAATEQPLSGTLPDDMPVEIIDGILAVVNESLPSLVRDCLDRDAQRLRLYQAMGDSFRDYVGRLASEASAAANNRLSSDRSRLQSELEQLRAERKQMESKRDEQQEQILSEQRQRRALTERVRDLETKLNSFDAEKEQYQLEIKSLLNKVRASEVREGDDEELRRQIDRMQAEMKALHTTNTELKSEIADKDREIAELTLRLNDIESASALNAALSARSEMLGESAADAVQNADTPEPEAEDVKPAPRRRRGRPKKPAASVDSDSAEIDWLLPGGVPASASSPAPDPDFGYQPPQRHASHPADDNQPTLF